LIEVLLFIIVFKQAVGQLRLELLLSTHRRRPSDTWL
jgi:hypothetical protein